MAETVDIADIMVDMADIMADTADILARYRREADTSSAEVGRNSPAAHREHIITGAAATGAAVTGVAVTGAADLVIRTTTGTCIPLGAGASLTRLTTAIIPMGILRMGTDLVIRITGIRTPLGAGAFLTRLTTTIILTGIVLRIGTIMITITTPLTVTAASIDLRSHSCSAGWLERVTTMVPLMESWGRELVVRFAPMNGRTGH